MTADNKHWCDGCPFANYTGSSIMCQLIEGSCYKVGKDTIVKPIPDMVTEGDMRYYYLRRSKRRTLLHESEKRRSRNEADAKHGGQKGVHHRGDS